MSNKQWRRPAPGAGEAQPLAADSKPAASAAAEAAPAAPPATSTSAAPPRLHRMADDYLEKGRYGSAEVPPGTYRTKLGANLGVPDMRNRVLGLGKTGEPSKPLSDAETAIIAADSVRFLWQVVVLTSRILDSVQLGDLRQVVAAEFAMPGDVILEDGTFSRHPDAFKVEEDRNEPAARERARAAQAEGEPSQQSKAGRKPRGSSHPLLVLLRIAVQAARLIKQIGGGTNPTVFNKIQREAQQTIDAIRAGQDWANGVLKGI